MRADACARTQIIGGLVCAPPRFALGAGNCDAGDERDRVRAALARHKKVDIPAPMSRFVRHRCQNVCAGKQKRAGERHATVNDRENGEFTTLFVYSTGIARSDSFSLSLSSERPMIVCVLSSNTIRAPSGWGALKGFATNLHLKRTTFFRVQCSRCAEYLRHDPAPCSARLAFSNLSFSSGPKRQFPSLFVASLVDRIKLGLTKSL